VSPMATVTLPESDLRVVIRLLDDARQDAPADLVPWALLEGLADMIRCEGVQLCDLDWTNERLVAHQYLVPGGERGVDPPGKSDETAEYFANCREFLPCGDPAGAGAYRHPLRWSDFYSDRQLRDTRAYQCFFQPVRTSLSVVLSSPPGRALRVLFMSTSTREYTDRDVMLLELLRPHLYEIVLDTERRRGSAPKLTAREWEILQLAAEGLSNREIAQQLYISAGTVRKHVEHILDHLGVHSRAEAAAIALPHRPALRRRPPLHATGQSPVRY
jgi:DNA-binding CsgD family transcriptional regulator